MQQTLLMMLLAEVTKATAKLLLSIHLHNRVLAVNIWTDANPAEITAEAALARW